MSETTNKFSCISPNGFFLPIFLHNSQCYSQMMTILPCFPQVNPLPLLTSPTVLNPTPSTPILVLPADTDTNFLPKSSRTGPGPLMGQQPPLVVIENS